MISEDRGVDSEGMRDRTDQVGLERSAAMSRGALGCVSELYFRVERIWRFWALRPCRKDTRQLLHIKFDILNVLSDCDSC